MGKKTFYVTTPIYYGTAKPHLGSLYSTLIADVVNRWEQLKGANTYFLTGTDEHGQKIAQAAQKAGKEPQEFVDSFIMPYKRTWQEYDIKYNQFIRTTDPEHKKGVQALVATLIKTGDIYKDSYEGWYCTPCETFVTPSSADKKESPSCPSCGRETVAIAEESYFFKLSAYQEKLLEFYKNNPDFIVPKERTQEVISFVQSGLKDLSISRTTIDWGVPFPEDPKHVIYVWVDALINYISAIGYGNPARIKEFDTWWPANLQVLGKDIVRFHAVYWPAILMAADLPLPKKLLVHGWIQIDKQKMSKSLGNAIDPDELAKTYGAEQVRYYLMRQIPVNSDGEFSIADLESRINSDLANDLGNLLNRMLLLALKNNLSETSKITVWSAAAVDLRDQAFTMIEEFEEHMRDYEFHLALARLWKFINSVNSYFHSQEPWKLAKKDPVFFAEIISATAHSLRIIALLLLPIMPEKMKELLASLGHEPDIGTVNLEDLELGNWHQLFRFKKIDPLFSKIELKKEPQMEEQKKEENYIKIDDLAKVELRVGTITKAEAIEESEKLIKMQVDLGEHGMRQILAGIRKSYAPEELIGKQGLFVCNLKPRKMLGMESQGMMLIAPNKEGKVQILSPQNIVPEGTHLQ